MADLRQVVNSGPDDDSLLYLQSRHISQDIWINKRDRILRIRRCILVDNLPLAIVPHLRAAGFYGVSRLGTFEHNPALVSALVERWRPETHTFHTTKGECTITLQDVAVQFGLPCGGKPVTGGASMDWQTLCERLLGVAPPSSKLDGQRLSMNWLADTFSHLPEDATDEQVACFSRAYILRLIGGYLMPDKSGNKVYLMYLPFLEDFTEYGGFSWGSAVLAHLYRELCMATDPKQKEIGGCLTLLHIWAWDRFPRIAPFTRPISNLDLEHYPLLPPLGHRWRGAKDSVGPAKEALKHYRLLLDRMTDLEIIWCPYEGEVFQMIPEYCLVDQNVWRAYVPLICFHIVEWHHPDRVLRQFGGDQSIPQPPINLGRHHTLQLTGKYDKNWTVEHQEFIKQWDAWQERVIQLQSPSLPLQQNSEYMRWY